MSLTNNGTEVSLITVAAEGKSSNTTSGSPAAENCESDSASSPSISSKTLSFLCACVARIAFQTRSTQLTHKMRCWAGIKLHCERKKMENVNDCRLEQYVGDQTKRSKVHVPVGDAMDNRPKFLQKVKERRVSPLVSHRKTTETLLLSPYLFGMKSCLPMPSAPRLQSCLSPFAGQYPTLLLPASRLH